MGTCQSERVLEAPDITINLLVLDQEAANGAKNRAMVTGLGGGR